MTRIAGFLAATLAAALCLLIGWRIGRLSTEPYPDNGFRDDERVDSV